MHANEAFDPVTAPLRGAQSGLLGCTGFVDNANSFLGRTALG